MVCCAGLFSGAVLECITSLNQLGVNHIRFVAYYPGADVTGIRDIQIAVTPDEERYVPKEISQVINIGQRKIDCGTIVELLLKLKLYNMLVDARIKSYFASIVSNSYSFDELFSRSAQLESGFQSLVNVIDIGIIGVNSDMEIYV